MTYILVTVKKSIDTQESNIRGKAFLERRGYVDDDDEGNESRFEQDTLLSSRKTMDTPIVIKNIAEKGYVNYINYFNLDSNVLHEQYEFYKDNVFKPTQINNFMVCMFYGKMLGGAASVSLLNYNEYCKLSVLLQNVILDFNNFELAQLITAIPATTTVLDNNIGNARLKLIYKTTPAYRACRARFEQISMMSAKRWDNVFTEITDIIADQPWLYNSSPHVWNTVGGMTDELHNGKRVIITDNAIEDMCSFIYKVCNI